jgi:hypothetical protein
MTKHKKFTKAAPMSKWILKEILLQVDKTSNHRVWQAEQVVASLKNPHSPLNASNNHWRLQSTVTHGWDILLSPDLLWTLPRKRFSIWTEDTATMIKTLYKLQDTDTELAKIYSYAIVIKTKHIK